MEDSREICGGLKESDGEVASEWGVPRGWWWSHGKYLGVSGQEGERREDVEGSGAESCWNLRRS